MMEFKEDKDLMLIIEYKHLRKKGASQKDLIEHLKHGYDVNQKHEDDKYFIQDAVFSRRDDLAAYLVERGANYNIGVKYPHIHDDLFIEAVSKNLVKTVTLILQKGIELSGREAILITVAANKNAFGVLDVLFSRDEITNHAYSPDEIGIIKQCKFNSLKMPIELLKKLISIGYIPASVDDQLQELLLRVVESRELDKVELLLKNGWSSNYIQHGAHTPLGRCILSYSREIFEKLIECNANVFFVDSFGRTFLHTAAMVEDSFFAEKLLSLGLSRIAKDNDGNTPVMVALLHSRQNNIKLLLDKQLTEYFTQEEICAFVRRAYAYGNYQTIFTLSKLPGFNINARHKDNFTLVNKAAQHEQRDLVTYLIHKKADLSIPDNDGCIPLHYIAKITDRALNLLALSVYPNIFLKDNNGTTPYSLGIRNRYISIRDMFKLAKNCVLKQQLTLQNRAWIVCIDNKIDTSNAPKYIIEEMIEWITTTTIDLPFLQVLKELFIKQLTYNDNTNKRQRKN